MSVEPSRSAEQLKISKKFENR